MKKIILVCLIAVITVFCTSCSESVKIPEIRVSVEDNAVVTIKNTEYQCHISYVNDTTSSVAFSSPENLKNVTFGKSENEQYVSLGKLICKNKNFNFSENCVFNQIINAFSALKQDNIKFLSKQNDLYMFTLKSDPVCKFFTDENGNIKSLVNNSVKIKFE